MDIVDLVKATDFLGREFLIWLWYRCERDGGHFNIDGHGVVELYFDDSITLTDGDSGGEQHILTGPEPARSDEAKLALRRGKLPKKAKLRLIKDQKEWLFTYHGEALRVHGASLPALLTQEEDDQLLERMYLIEELDVMLNTLYGQFINLRIDASGWAEETAAMRAWLGDQPLEAEAAA